jgi:hypothetical protein
MTELGWCHVGEGAAMVAQDSGEKWQDSGEKWDFPAAVHATVSGFCYRTVILGIRVFYRHMAAGAHYPEDWGRPNQGTREGGVPDLILDRSG